MKRVDGFVELFTQKVPAVRAGHDIIIFNPSLVVVIKLIATTTLSLGERKSYYNLFSNIAAIFVSLLN